MRHLFSKPLLPVLCRFLGGFCVAMPEMRISAHKRRLWHFSGPKKCRKTPVVTSGNKSDCDFSAF
jgi:hypothetical protein